MLDLLKSPVIQKVLTGIIGTAFAWANKKYNLGIDSTQIAAATVSIIIGIALHNAAKDHGVNAVADAPADPTKPSA